MWQQVYDPFGNSVLSTIVAAIPVVTLLVLIAAGAVKTKWSSGSRASRCICGVP